MHVPLAAQGPWSASRPIAQHSMSQILLKAHGQPRDPLLNTPCPKSCSRPMVSLETHCSTLHVPLAAQGPCSVSRLMMSLIFKWQQFPSILKRWDSAHMGLEMGTQMGQHSWICQMGLEQWDQHLNIPNMGHGTDQWGSVNGIWWMETETYWTAVLSSTLFKDGCQSWDPRHFKNGASRWEKDGEKDGRNWNGRKMGEKMGPTWRKLRSKANTKKFLTLYLGIVWWELCLCVIFLTFFHHAVVG